MSFQSEGSGLKTQDELMSQLESEGGQKRGVPGQGQRIPSHSGEAQPSVAIHAFN